MLDLNISKGAQKFIHKLHEKQQKQILDKILLLRLNPYPPSSKQLKNSSYYSMRSGEYRILYRLENQVLYIFSVGKRNDSEVYKHPN